MSDPHHGIFTLIESGDVAAVSSTLEQHPHLLTAREEYGGMFPGPPLHAAAWHDQPEVVKCLLGRGAALQAKDEGGETALHIAAWRGSTGAARALLDLGAALEDQNTYGQTPLHWASYNGRLEMLELLLERGGRTSAQSSSGETPLYWAQLGSRGQQRGNGGESAEGGGRGQGESLEIAQWPVLGVTGRVLVVSRFSCFIGQCSSHHTV